MHAYTRLEILFGDLRQFVRENPGTRVYSADERTDDGTIFLGWVAHVGEGNETRGFHATCPASAAASLPRELQECLSTEEGRLRLERLLERG